MMPEDRLRSALQRLVPPPDEQAGWQQVNRRMVRAKRARVAVVGVAAAMTLGLGAAVVGAVQHDSTQHLNLASPHQTTGPRTTGSEPTTGPSFPGTTPASSTPGGSSIPGGGAGSTGGSGSTDPSTPATASAGGSHPVSTAGSGTTPTTPVTAATTVPGHGGSAVTTPTTEPTTAGPSTTLGAPDPTADLALAEAAVHDQVESYLAPYGNQVHGVTDTHLATNAAGGGPQWRIQVALRADATSLAADLLQRFPGHVVVTVGFFPYPSGPTPGASCTSSAPAPSLPTTVSATARIPSVSRGADFSGTITITNQLAVPMPVSGSTTVDLLLPGSNTVVATYDGTAGNRASSTTLGLGASTDLTITGGTGSCTGLGGYALPAGTYDGRVRITVAGAPAEFRFPVTVTG